MKYITRLLAAQGAIRNKYHPILYWTAYYLNPEVALVNEARREAAELVRPVLEARHAAHSTQTKRFMDLTPDTSMPVLVRDTQEGLGPTHKSQGGGS